MNLAAEQKQAHGHREQPYVAKGSEGGGGTGEEAGETEVTIIYRRIYKVSTVWHTEL